MNTYVASVKIGTLLISALMGQGAQVVVQPQSNGSTLISFIAAPGAVTAPIVKMQTIPAMETATQENSVQVAKRVRTTSTKSGLKRPSPGACFEPKCDRVARR